MFVVKQITGFCGFAPIAIFDKKGRPFYVKEKSRNRDNSVYFNLPAGSYITNNKLFPLSRPIEYVLPKLPRPEFKRKLPKLRIVVEPNPRKCSIYFETGIIKLDPEYAAKPKPNLMHILLHELGHFLYVSEWKCDLFSCFNMLKLGYNPSQCLKVMVHNLSSNKNETVKRATKNHNYLKRVKYYL